jgi:hypothetical protein
MRDLAHELGPKTGKYLRRDQIAVTIRCASSGGGTDRNKPALLSRTDIGAGVLPAVTACYCVDEQESGNNSQAHEGEGDSVHTVRTND